MVADPARASDWLLRNERAVYLALVLVTLIPVWLSDRFPSQDGPIHLYIAHIARRLAEADGGAYRDFFAYNPYLEPNELIHWLLGAFVRVLPPLTAEKLLVSLYWLGFAGAARYAVTSRGQAVLAFLFLPIGFGYFLHFGFYNFSFGIAGFLLLLGFALRRAERLDLPTLAVLAGGAFLLVVTHLFALAMFLASFGAARAGIAVARAVKLGGAAAWRREGARLMIDGLKVGAACIPAFIVAGSFFLRHMQSGDPAVAGSIKFNLLQLAIISVSHSLSEIEFWTVVPYIALVWLLVGLAALQWVRARDRAAALVSVMPLLLLLGIYLLATLQVKFFSAQDRLLPFIFCLFFLAIAQIGVPLWAKRLIVPVLALVIMASTTERARFYTLSNEASGELMAAGATVRPGATLRTIYTAIPPVVSVRTPQHESLAGRGHGWRVDVLEHVPALVAIQRDAISLSHDLLSPAMLGYFPVHFRAARDPHRRRMPPVVEQPIAWLERSIGRRIDHVFIWPNREPTSGHSPRAAGQIRAALAEARMRYEEVPALSATAPLTFRRRAVETSLRER